MGTHHISGRYEEADRRAVEGMTHGPVGSDGHIMVDLLGMEGALAFKRAGLSIILGEPFSGKTILCDTIVVNSTCRTLYLPLQSTSGTEARERLSALDAGVDYWKVVTNRSMQDRIAMKEADERLLSGKTVVCVDDVTPSLLNDILIDVLGESDSDPGTVDESADCLIVLDNIDMIQMQGGATLRERIQMLKDIVKGKRCALVAVVAGDTLELREDVCNADEIYAIERDYAISLPPSVGYDPTFWKGTESRKWLLLDNVKTSRFDGHPRTIRLTIHLPTRAVNVVT